VKLRPTALSGAFVIEPERHEDARGYFTRTFCRDELRAARLFTEIAQSSISFNRKRGTLRGLHFQADPQAEEKIVSCTRGAVLDVIVDLRPGSETFARYVAEELTPENGFAMYVPKGFAHGFQTLEDGATLAYSISVPYVASASAGVRWDDPDIGVRWPLEATMISDRDRGLPTVAEWLRTAAGGRA
jgi:dTDP-4-dehydrorhamnose 3,5-epimerase